MMTLTLSRYFSILSLIWSVVASLTINAPAACGGVRVITHATAFFGPRLSQPSNNLLPIFAGYPEGVRGGGGGVKGMWRLDTGCGIWGGGRGSVRLGRKRKGKEGRKVRSGWENVKGKVGFVVRGECDFVEKVLGLEMFGAVGVVVVNEVKEKKLVNMKINDTRRSVRPRIPSVMVNWRDWVILSQCRDQGVKVALSREGEATLDSDYERDALNWILMRGMALWILCQCGISVVRYKRRAGEMRARADAVAALPTTIFRKKDYRARNREPCIDGDDFVPKNGHGFEQRAQIHPRVRPKTSSFSYREWWRFGRKRKQTSPKIGPVANTSTESGRIETKRVRQHDDDDSFADSDVYAPLAPTSSPLTPQSPSLSISESVDEPMCPVCLENFVEGQLIRRLAACNHEFCVGCIDRWLIESSNSCPICKREVDNLPPPRAQHRPGSVSV